MGGFGEAHGSFRIGQINNGGIWLLDLTVGKGLHLMEHGQKLTPILWHFNKVH